MRRLALLLSTLTLTALVVVASVRWFSESRLDLQSYVVVPKPLVPRVSNFSCINSPSMLNRKKVSAVLHGPDWTLESAIEPSCLRERDVVFSTEIPTLLVKRPVPRRTHMWVIQNCNRTFVRIVESSGLDEQDMIATGLVTNHKCASRTSKNCNIEGGPLPPHRID